MERTRRGCWCVSLARAGRQDEASGVEDDQRPFWVRVQDGVSVVVATRSLHLGTEVQRTVAC